MLLVRKKADALYDAALALCYPQACAVCGESVERRADGVACAACWRQTRIFDAAESLCCKCGAPATGTPLNDVRAAIVNCHRCDDEAFAAVRACGAYELALRASVLALKREPHISARLAQLIFETGRRPPLNKATRIVPVPLHPSRERERGFNQSAVLARAVAALSDVPLDEGSLARTYYTGRHRAGMDARSRRESVQDAFEVRRPRLIEGESVLLVDDVLTTGATVSACAIALLQSGAREVFVLTVARPL